MTRSRNKEKKLLKIGNQFPSEEGGPKTAKSAGEEKIKGSLVPTFLTNYVRNVEAFRSVTPLIVNVATFVGEANSRKFKEYISEADGSIDTFIEGLSPQKRYDLMNYKRDAEQYFRTGSEIPPLMLTAIVAEMELLFSEMCKWVFKKVPEKIRSIKKTLDIADLDEAHSMEELKDFFVDKEVDEILRKSVSEQIDSLEKLLDVGVSHAMARKHEFLEIFERRNIMMHAGGKASRQYLNSLRKIGFPREELPPQGKNLAVSQEYFEKSTEALLNFGTLFGLRVWHKFSKDQRRDQDSWYVHHIFSKILNRQYQGALDFIAMAEKLDYRFTDAQSEYMLRINKAQCLKWLDKNEECQKLLDQVDWSAHAHHFIICEKVLRDDFEGAAKVVREAGVVGVIEFDHYCLWPVFQSARKNKSFQKAVEETFGCPLVPIQRTKLAIASSPDDEKPGNSKRPKPSKRVSVH